MPSSLKSTLCIASCILLMAQTVRGQTPLGTDFTYQGQLKASGMPAVTTADFKYSLFNDPAAGAQIGATLSKDNVALVSGLFTLPLDFGGTAFNGEARWLAVQVRSPAGSGSFTTLAPRQPVNASPYALQTRGIVVDPTGNVGIGTTTPAMPMHIRHEEPVLILQDSGSNATQSGYLGFWNSSAAETGWFGFGSPGSPDIGIVNARTAGDICLSPGSGGKVGIGTFTPSKLLHIRGSAPSMVIQDTANPANQSGYVGFWNTVPQETGGVGFVTPASADLFIFNSRPNGNIELDPGPGGAVRVPVLEITGADLAEKFPSSEKLEPGMVVAIDRTNAGKLCMARGAYNRCVAGVVSGANNFSAGAVLGNLPGHEDAPPIALSGRVYVHCDASNGPIEPGDMLTSSETPGHAMKATDRDRIHGAVIGRAMSSLAAGERAMVLVLINLQ